MYIHYPGRGVTSLNGLTGDITLAAGSGISITPSGNTLTIASTGSPSFPILAPDGSAGAPSYSFSSSASTGMYYTGTNNLSFSAGGTEIVRLLPGGQTASVAGTVSAPGYTFITSPTTGMYLPSGNTLAFATNGTVAVTISSTQNVTIAGTTTPSGGIVGTTSASATGAGLVGQIISSITAAASVGTSGQFFDATSISLTAGHWIVSGLIEYVRSASTFTSTVLAAGISTTTGNSATGLTASTYAETTDVVPVTFTNHTMLTPNVHVEISATTTYYLKGFTATYTVGTPQYVSSMIAHRIA